MGIWTDAVIAPPNPTLPRAERSADSQSGWRASVWSGPRGSSSRGSSAVNASLTWGSVRGQARRDQPCAPYLLLDVGDEPVVSVSDWTPRRRAPVRPAREGAGLGEMRDGCGAEGPQPAPILSGRAHGIDLSKTALILTTSKDLSLPGLCAGPPPPGTRCIQMAGSCGSTSLRPRSPSSRAWA